MDEDDQNLGQKLDKNNLIPIRDTNTAIELGRRGGSVSSEAKSIAAKFRELKKRQCVSCTKRCLLYDPVRTDCQKYQLTLSVAEMSGASDPNILFDHFLEVLVDQRVELEKNNDPFLRDKYLRRLLEFVSAKFGTRMRVDAVQTKLSPSQINDLIADAAEKRMMLEQNKVNNMLDAEHSA